MDQLEAIAEGIHHKFEARTAARDKALAQARTLTRHCANAIRAIHRNEQEIAEEHLVEARRLVQSLQADLSNYPELYYAGYTQDALKEFAEASLVCSLIQNRGLPTPEGLGLESATYLQGLAEAVGELRRRCLDLLLKDQPGEAERMLAHMDDIYGVLVTMDYPDAITGGLRRLTDLARGIIERTRGDLTISIRQGRLADSLQRMEENLGNGAQQNAGDPGL
jgi:translin